MVEKPIIDPTANVIALNAASEKYIEAQITNLLRETELRSAHAKELREYQTRLSQAESNRLDAIRAVDVNNVAISVQKATEQASVLAVQLTRMNEASSIRITTLEQALYKGEGKGAGVGMSMTAIVQVISSLGVLAGVVALLLR